MPESDLHISERLRKLLPPLTSEERKQLKANIEADGHVTDTIFYWNDGKRNVIVDGMNRWEIVKGTDIPYETDFMAFGDYEEVEVWILNHQLGRRNLLKPSAIRKIRGELYNRLKRPDKGHGKQSSKDAKAECQIDTPPPSAAKKIAEKAGVSESTVKRDGARVEAIEKLTKAAQAISDKASDADVKALSKLSASDQNAVARAIRVGEASGILDAMKQGGHKSTKPTTKRGASGKPKPAAATLVDNLTKKHIGHIARGLTSIAESNGGEGAQFAAADAGLNQLITALKEMRKGKK